MSARKTSTKILATLGLIAITGIGCPDPRVFGPPEKTHWVPMGARTVGSYDYSVIPQPDAFRTMHVGPNNSDNVWIAAAPMFEFDWVAETSMYIPSGPTYDNEGNLYFSPLYPSENVSLVSLDAETGARRWAIPGDGINAGSGPPLILNDPDHPGSQIIYHATYTEIMALRPDGSTIWSSSTGLSLPPVVPGESYHAHCFGVNYHPETDSLIAVTIDGKIFAVERLSGQSIAPISQIPGTPAVSVLSQIPQFVIDAADALMDAVFGPIPSGVGRFSGITDALFGGGFIVANYFGIDPNSSMIYVAATAPDGDDGTPDGESELGALYSLELVDDGNGGLQFSILNSVSFVGGTGSTPAVSEDGSRVYVSDNLGNVIALDSNLNELWRLDVGEPLAASVAVSPDNSELYAVTRQDVFKLIDNGNSGSLAWTATLNAFDGWPWVNTQSNALSPTITANGIVISVGGGIGIPSGDATGNAMLYVGMGILDRDTGQLRYFAEGREESISVSSIAPDGGIYTTNSPVRHAVGKALFPGLTQDIIGGISRYKPIRLDLLVRDAVCAAQARASNASSLAEPAELDAIDEDIRQLQLLLNQAGNAIASALDDGDMTQEHAGTLENLLSQSSANLTPAALSQAAADLGTACAIFE
jgi:hypothetical protein